MTVTRFLSRRIIIMGGVFVACAAIVIVMYLNKDDIRIRVEAERCVLSNSKPADQGGCWDTVITNEFHAHGVAMALHAVDLMYRTYPAFLDTNCHRHAHVVGDLAYYEQYAEDPNLVNDIQLTPDATACGYGFFAGFIEHLIQNHPDPAYFVSTCDDFIARWGNEMKGVRHMCYHAGAHGFMLAIADHATKSEWGNFQTFAGSALQACAKLAADRDKESCRQGVFHQLYLWKDAGEYGFVSDRPSLVFCDAQPTILQHACYFNLAQGFAHASNDDPVALAKIVAPIQDASLREVSFEVGMWNMVKDFIDTDPTMSRIVGGCKTLGDTFQRQCVSGLLKGMFIYGEPQHEYAKAIDFCSSSAIAATGLQPYCFSMVRSIALSYYAPDRVSSICGDFPVQFRSVCDEPIVPVSW